MTDIEWFFKEYVFGFMYNDLDTAICGKANFLTALGLLEYTEFIGGLVIGELGKNKGNKPLACRFNRFLFDYMGSEYRKVNDKINVYDIFRCGLAHEYFAKGPSPIRMHNRPPQTCGIIRKDKTWLFVVEKYYDDFKAGVAQYYNHLVVDKDKSLIDNFRKVIKIDQDAKVGYHLKQG